MADQSADDFLDAPAAAPAASASAAPSQSADDFLGDDKQTLGGFGQAAGTIIPRALTDIAGLPVDAVTNMFNLGQAARGANQAVNADQVLPKGERLSADSRSGITPKGLHHYEVDELDEEGKPTGSKQEIYSKDPPPDTSGAHPAYRSDVGELPALQDEPVPGSSEWAKDQIRHLGGSGLIDAQERTALNEYTQAVGEGATFGAVGGPGSIVRGMLAGGAAGGAQKAAADAGFSPGSQAAIGFIAGAAAGARGRRSTVEPPAGPGETKPSTAETILDTPDIKHEGAGAEVAKPPATDVEPPTPKAAPGASPEAVTPAEPAETPATAATGENPTPEAGAAPEGETGVTVEPTKIQHQAELPAGNHPMLNGKPYSLISAELTDKDPRMNVNRSIAMEQMLQSMGVPYARTKGSFQGSSERSFAVQTPNDLLRARIEALAGKFNQQSVIHVDENGNANYKDLGDDQQSGHIGTMQKVSQADAELAKGWTRDKQGNYYTIKLPAPAEEVPATKNGLGADPTKAQSMFEKPAQDGLSQVAKTPADQANRVDTFKRVGLDEVRNSAITGDSRQAGTEFQTSKLKGNEAGDRLASLIDNEREAVRQHAQGLISESGGSPGMHQPDLYSRGKALADPVNDWKQHLEESMADAYKIARVRAKDKPFKLDTLGSTLTNEKSQFLSTVEGKQLYEGVTARAKELGLTGPNETFNPATVDQAERFRQYLNDAWSPRTARLIGQLKSNLDQDVMKSAGEDLFERGRNIRTLISKTIEEPDAVSALVHTKEANKLGVNRQVDYEKTPSFITTQPADQFRHYVSTLKQIAQSGVPELRAKAVKALNEVRGQFANEYFTAGDNLKGMWNQKASNKYLSDHELNMRHVFSPEEMKKFQDNDNAGRWLHMDRTYPGAAVQGENIRSLAAKGVAKGAEGVGTAAGGAIGGGVPGAAVGWAVGKAIKAGAERVGANLTKAAAEKLITPLDKWEQPKPSAVPPGQRGSVSFQPIGSKNVGSRSKQGGGSIQDYLTPKERVQLRSDTTERMIKAFHDLPPTHELAAAALAGQAKKGWYRQSAEAIANVFGPDSSRFAATLAAMSPQTSVQANFHNAVRTFVNWDKAGRPTDPKAITQIMHDSVQRQPNGDGVLHAWVPNTIRALTHPNPETLPVPPTSGPKHDLLAFRHFSNATDDKVKLDPNYYGSGTPGAEAKRIKAGAPKVIAAYAANTPDAGIEPSVRQGRQEYSIHVPRAQMYDLSADPLNVKQRVADQDIAEGGQGVYDHSRAEKMIKDEGYTGYHLPEGTGGFKGQARFFNPVTAIRAGAPVDMKELQLSGPKVNSFMHNLRDNANEVTLDSWMANFAKIDPRSLAGKGAGSGPGKSPTYLAYSAKVREAASMLSHLTGEKWSPAEVQETVWSWAKTAYEHAAAEGKQIPHVVKRGDISDELIRATPDFHQLFSTPKHSGFLSGSRYASGAERVAGGQGSGAQSTGSVEKSAAAKKALRPHLNRAAERLNTRLTEKRASGDEAPF